MAKAGSKETDASSDALAAPVVDHLPVSLPAPEVEQQATPPETANDDEENTTGPITAYFRAANVGDLDEAYPAFKEALTVDSEEYWETRHRKRRAELGADDGVEGVRALIAENPTWAFPYAVLLDWSVRDHDLDAAIGYLEQGLSKQSSSNFEILLSSGVKLKSLIGGRSEALRFCVDYLKANIPSRMKAGAFFTLAEVLKDNGDIEGQRVALEWAIAIQPYDKDKAFSLAYSYAEANSHWAPAMWHYRKVVSEENDGPVAKNNFGILLGNFDKACQVQAYEEAAAGGDLYAPANLAHLLIADGYIAAAERLLKTVEDPGAAAELHSGAAAAALAARRKMNLKGTEIQRAVNEASQVYREAVARSFKRLQVNGEAASGIYVSADNMAAANIGPDSANVRIRISTVDYEGTLKNQTTCFSGLIGHPGETILGSYYIDATLIDEGGGVVRLFQWPGSIGIDYRGFNWQLNKFDGPMPPPPALSPPASPPYPNALSGLLALGTPPRS